MKLRTQETFFLDLLYPRRCPVCHNAAPQGHDICPSCVGRLPLIRGNRCPKCGKPVEAEGELCHDCRVTPHVYEEGVGIFLYEDIMRSSLSWLKYKGRREYGTVLGMLMGYYGKEMLRSWRADALVPVPVHRKRLLKRGYNQAEELAKGLSRTVRLPVFADALVRTRETAAMKELTPRERRKNLAGAFSSGRGSVRGKRAVLIDDIYTTGATIDVCASYLKQQGAEAVFFMTLATGGGYLTRY